MKAFLVFLILSVTANAVLSQNSCQFNEDCGETGGGIDCFCDQSTNLCNSPTGDACSDCGAPIGAFCYSATDCCADNCVAQDPGCDGGTTTTACSSCPTNCCDFVPSSECQVSEQQCDEPNGVCLTSNVEDGTPCTDGFCVSGVCQTQPCAYNEDCGDCDCDTDLGVCVVAGCLPCAGSPIGASCSSGRDCCLGNCIDGSCSSCSVDCSTQDFGECKVSTGCDEPTGDCLISNVPDQTPCDGGFCFDGVCELLVCEGGCTQTVQYWQDNVDLWPEGTADNEICEFTWEEWMAATADPGSITELAQLIISAGLNIESGACAPRAIDQLVEEFFSLVDQANCTGISPGARRRMNRDVVSSEAHTRKKRFTIIQIRDLLVDYNSGVIGPGACPDEEECESGCVLCTRLWYKTHIRKEFVQRKICGRALRSWLRLPGGCDGDDQQHSESSGSESSHDREDRNVDGHISDACRMTLRHLGGEYSAILLNTEINGACADEQDASIHDDIATAEDLLGEERCNCGDNDSELGQMQELANTFHEFNNGNLGVDLCTLPTRSDSSDSSKRSRSHDDSGSSKSHKKRRKKHSSSSS